MNNIAVNVKLVKIMQHYQEISSIQLQLFMKYFITLLINSSMIIKKKVKIFIVER